MADTALVSNVGSRVERLLFTTPLTLIAVGAVLLARVIHGYSASIAMQRVEFVASNPFEWREPLQTWLYQQPIGPMLAWVLGMNDGTGIARVHFACTLLVVVGCALLVRRWHSDLAARLFVVAWFCSPQAWAGTAALGLFDILTVAGLTVAMIAPVSVLLPVGVLLGFQNFEQAAFALAVVAVFRVQLRGDRARDMVPMFVGLLAGRALLAVYLSMSGIPADGRFQFLREHWRELDDGLWSSMPVVVWAVFNVLWVPIIWAMLQRPRREQKIVAWCFAVLTVPVLITFDLSRVYRNLTWPVVMLVVIWCAEHRDQRLVRSAALWLVVAACFVPRTEVWHGGILHN